MEPRLSVKETLTDNLKLSYTNEQREAVTQVKPGVAIHEKGGRSTLDLDYGLNGLIYANESAYNDVYHELDADAHQRLVGENVSVAERASVRQQIVDPRLSVPSDILNPGNVSTVVSYSIAPAARGSLGGIVDMNVDFLYGRVDYLDTDAASDSIVSGTAVSLRNGRQYSRLSWGINYDKSVTDRLDATDTRYESGEASLHYRLSQSWFTYAVGGRENNSVPSAQTVQNGSYWRAGLGWKPGPAFSIEASYGDLSKQASITWEPQTRTSLTATYLNQDVGVNPGVTWSGSFRHRTPNTTWRADYSEQAINVQRLDLVGQDLFVLVDTNGNPILDSATGQPFLIAVNSFTLTDQDFISKRGSVGLSAKSAFTVSGVNLFDETREYQISGGSERLKGINGTVVWKFASRTSLRINGSLSRWDSDSISGTDRIDLERVGFVRNIGPTVNGSLYYVRNARSNASDPQRDYVENRIEAELTKHW